MPALGLLIVATLGITNDVSGGFIIDNTTRHYTVMAWTRKTLTFMIGNPT
jgi:hypothetical protein